MLHGCTIEDDTLIGIGSIILNGAKIGKGSVVAAGALVPEGMEVPPSTLVMGVPAKVKRAVTAEEQARFAEGVQHYVEKAAVYRESH
jgi:gamma-carbonic anhydrase